ncbi:hypothetical protein ACI77O_13035 [Pseudomonas tritici]|uniref:hypothetical protein n=1 Tax=Pseudomonas tritici TaxID=2745518 RepID=UPI00387B8B21
MSLGLTFDPYELMPFVGYIEPSTGRQELYPSLAHFFHSEQISGMDEHYRNYLLKLNDPELFRLEVDGVGIGCGEKSDWEHVRMDALYAGIFMQALSNRERYGEFFENADKLSVASCSFSSDAATVLGEFIQDLHDPQGALKVVFLGAVHDLGYIELCLDALFANRAPQCVFALEDDGCSLGVSSFARSRASAFSLLNASLSEDAIVENITRRSTHIFHFQGGADAPLTSSVVQRLLAEGVSVLPIQPKA